MALPRQFFSLTRSHLKRSSDIWCVTSNTKPISNATKTLRIMPSSFLMRRPTMLQHRRSELHSCTCTYMSLRCLAVDCSPFTAAELSNKVRCNLDSQPFDKVEYDTFKKCQPLLPALACLFNFCWVLSFTDGKQPQSGKLPELIESRCHWSCIFIALVPLIGKLFTTLLGNHWLECILISGSFVPLSRRKPSSLWPMAVLSTVWSSPPFVCGPTTDFLLCASWVYLVHMGARVQQSLIQLSLATTATTSFIQALGVVPSVLAEGIVWLILSM